MLARRFHTRAAGAAALALTVTVALALTVTVMLIAPAGAEAQATGSPEGLFLGFGGGWARGAARVGGETGRASGGALAGQMAIVKGGWRRGALDVQYEPFLVPNPVRSEHYSALNVTLLGYLGPLGLGLGYQTRFWGGDDPWVPSDGGLTLMVSGGPGPLVWRGWVMQPDFFWRGAAGIEIGTSSVGVRVILGRIVG
jgi:hypothetical protein